ncbi:hypothetical protein AG1IA_04551 [Rhizoctonia solani AG-1 IA]|uniref:Uncharacterized protein n=1 Tax=Thanatephorus cucumeris (strain AG1-IA) TaxID=983506 RepID=L8WXD2_THACA|nr:hypothetical protein AG1IA_04551 [Rhizoctonia solani AG-1 IA]
MGSVHLGRLKVPGEEPLTTSYLIIDLISIIGVPDQRLTIPPNENEEKLVVQQSTPAGKSGQARAGTAWDGIPKGTRRLGLAPEVTMHPSRYISKIQCSIRLVRLRTYHPSRCTLPYRVRIHTRWLWYNVILTTSISPKIHIRLTLHEDLRPLLFNMACRLAKHIYSLEHKVPRPSSTEVADGIQELLPVQQRYPFNPQYHLQSYKFLQ